MKRFVYLVYLAVLSEQSIFAQTTVWEETFNNPKQGWEIQGNWAFEPGILVLSYAPIIINYDFSAVSPEIFLPENPSGLVISQFLETYPSSVSGEACEISIMKNGAADVIWNYQLADGNWGVEGGEEISFSLAPYAGETIRIKFRSWGPTTDAWWDWSVYFVGIESVFNNDLSATKIIGPSNVLPDETNFWQVLVKNKGLLPQSGFVVKLLSAKTGDEFGSQQFSGTLSAGDSAFFIFEWNFGSVQNTCLYGKVISEEDQFQDNNLTPGHFVRVEPGFEYHVLVWDNDNGIETIFNPETAIIEQPDAAFSKALNTAGIGFTLASSLPDNLYYFDIIFCTLGCYCLS